MAQKFVIKGGNPLVGTVSVKGAKNSISKLLIASLLTKDEVKLTNVPLNQETEIALELCGHIGSEIKRNGSEIIIRTPEIKNFRVQELSRKNRIPVLALGPLLIRTGEAEVPMVGGDKIGPRPIDFHINSLKKLGAEILTTESAIVAKAKELTGAKIDLPYPSVGATENSILAAVLAKGKTVITNAAVEPEIVDMIKMLQNMGAIIELGANRIIYIEGVSELHGVEHELIPDRLEAASFAIMAIATNGNILVKNAVQEHLISFLNAIRRMGGKFEVEAGDGIRFYRNGELKATEIETDTYPGFATDWQQPTAVLLTQAKGDSIIHETVYEDRFGYTEDLNKMGAEIEVKTDCLGEVACRFKNQNYKHSAIIHGPTALSGASIQMRDIRAGMAQIIVGLITKGETEITGIEHIDRGYEDIDGRIRSLGGDIERIDF